MNRIDDRVDGEIVIIVHNHFACWGLHVLYLIFLKVTKRFRKENLSEIP